MPMETIIKVFDDAKSSGVYSICISWRGEATLYRVRDESGNIKTFGDAIKYASSKNFLELTSLTHGQNLSDESIGASHLEQFNLVDFPQCLQKLALAAISFLQLEHFEGSGELHFLQFAASSELSVPH
mgnify:CR=1 FL=1